jgi:hypothetical protein
MVATYLNTQLNETRKGSGTVAKQNLIWITKLKSPHPSDHKNPNQTNLKITETV